MGDLEHLFQPMNYVLSKCKNCKGSINLQSNREGFCSEKCKEEYMRNIKTNLSPPLEMKLHVLNPTFTQWLKRAHDCWGKIAQIDLFIEESAELMKNLSELIQSIMKNRRIIPLNSNDTTNYEEKIAEEIADVEMMLLQTVFLFDNQLLVERYMTTKFQRLREKVINEEEKQKKDA